MDFHKMTTTTTLRGLKQTIATKRVLPSCSEAIFVWQQQLFIKSDEKKDHIFFIYFNRVISLN